MLSKATEIILRLAPLGLAASFVAVVGAFLFLLLNPDRLRAHLSKTAVRRFVEYFGNVGLGEEGAGE